MKTSGPGAILTLCLSTLEPALKEAEGVGFQGNVESANGSLAAF
jgi:hypothetical protein